MGLNTELTLKYVRVKVKMTYVHPHTYINKQVSPIFNCVTPESVLLAPLARQTIYKIDTHFIIELSSHSCCGLSQVAIQSLKDRISNCDITGKNL